MILVSCEFIEGCEAWRLEKKSMCLEISELTRRLMLQVQTTQGYQKHMNLT